MTCLYLLFPRFQVLLFLRAGRHKHSARLISLPQATLADAMIRYQHLFLRFHNHHLLPTLLYFQIIMRRLSFLNLVETLLLLLNLLVGFLCQSHATIVNSRSCLANFEPFRPFHFTWNIFCPASFGCSVSRHFWLSTNPLSWLATFTTIQKPPSYQARKPVTLPELQRVSLPTTTAAISSLFQQRQL